MSIEDEARKELERRKQEETQRKVAYEKSQQELEQARNALSSKNQALLATLNLAPIFLELRDKYWKVGKLCSESEQPYLEKQIDWFGLKYTYEAMVLKSVRDPDSDYDIRTIGEKSIKMMVGIQRQSEELVTVHYNYNGTDRELIESSYQFQYERLHKCPIHDNQFTDPNSVKNWIKNNILETIIKMTGGELSRRDVYREGFSKNKEQVEIFKKKTP